MGYIYILHSVHVSHSTDACTFYFVNSVFKLSTSYLCHSTSAILFRIDTSRCHCCTESELGQIIEQRDLRLWRWVPFAFGNSSRYVTSNFLIGLVTEQNTTTIPLLISLNHYQSVTTASNYHKKYIKSDRSHGN